MESVDEEQWKIIPGFSYAVSSFGRVLRTEVTSKYSNSRAGKLLKPWKMPNGYVAVTLIKDGKKCAFTVHRLVMETFIGMRSKGEDIHHIDGCKTNNRLDNLGYTTRSANSSVGIKKESRFTQEIVDQIRDLVVQGYRQGYIAALLNTSEATISRVLNDKVKLSEKPASVHKDLDWRV